MDVPGVVPETFRRLSSDGARFEALVCQLLEAMGYRIIESPAIGTEGGRDVLVERTTRDEMVERRETVLVQCKHYAHSGRAVADSDVGVWQNAMTRYKARGYLLVTDTRVTENLGRSFREFSEDEANYPRWAAFWDVDKLIAELDRQPQVRDSFFPPCDIKRSSLEELALEVRLWLEAIRYQIRDMKQMDERCINMIATLEEGTIQQRVLVRCIGGEITGSDVRQLNESLTVKLPQGWLVSDQRVSPGAHQEATEDDATRVFTLSSFLSEMVWGPYFEALQSLVSESRLADLYVDLACYRQQTDERGIEVARETYPSLDAHIDAWLIERGKMHISLLGEFGAGKTWFCRHYASRQLERYLKDPVGQRLPILITLRAFSKAMTAQQLINDAFLEQYRLPFVGSAYEVFQEMNRRGKLVLILDGFDEMARRVDYQTVVDNFWELAKLVDEESKVILTSRTEYFRWAKESEKILGGEEYGRGTILLSPPKFEVLHLQPFSEGQIRNVITLLLGPDQGPDMAERVLSDGNLAAMAGKPVLIELLLAALEETSADAVKNTADVYLYATNKLLLRNIAAQKTFTSTADKLYFLCELAWEMLRTNELRIHFADIPERIRAYFGDQIKDQHELDTWDFDLRSQTLLHRDAAGYYEFAHKSLAEYFVALKFASELGCLRSRFCETYTESDGRFCKPPLESKDVTELARTFGAMRLGDERIRVVRSLLHGMMADDCVEHLLEIVDQTRGRSFEDVLYSGGNACSLVPSDEVQRAGASLSGAVIAGVSWRLEDCGGFDFGRATLREGEFFQCSLNCATFEGADLRGTRIRSSSLIGANLRGADLTGIELMEIVPTSVCWPHSSAQLFAGTEDGSIWAWDTNEWTQSLILSGLHSSVCSIVERPNSKQLFFADRGDTCVLWDAESQREIRRFRNPHGMAHQLGVSPDGRLLAMVDNSGRVVLFDIAIGEQVRAFPVGAKGTLFCVCFSQDAKRLIIGGNGCLTICDAISGEQVAAVVSPRTHGPFYRVKHSRHGNTVIVGGAEGILAADSATGRILFETGSGFTEALAYNLDESAFVAGDIHGNLSLFDAASGESVRKFSPGGDVRDLAFSPGGKCIATADRASCSVRIWNAEKGTRGFGKYVKTLGVKANYKGASIEGAGGLAGTMAWHVDGKLRNGTVLEYFAYCGAELSDEQKLQIPRAQEPLTYAQNPFYQDRPSNNEPRL